VFTGAQLSVYGEVEYETLGSVLRSGDAGTKLTVAQAIINKIGWDSDVADIDGFLRSYHAQLRVRYEAGLLRKAGSADRAS
jgi:hypothetical protein